MAFVKFKVLRELSVKERVDHVLVHQANGNRHVTSVGAIQRTCLYSSSESFYHLVCSCS